MTIKEIDAMVETLRAIQASRFPKTKAAPKATSKKRQAKPVGKQATIDDVISTDDNEADDDPTPPPAASKLSRFQPDPAMLRNIEESKAERAAG